MWWYVHNYPAVRTGSGNTHFFSVVFVCFFFGGHLPQTSGFRSAKQILVVSFATQARAFILSDRNTSYTPGGGGGGRTTAGSNAPGAFLVCFCFFQQESYSGPAVEAISPSAPGKVLFNTKISINIMLCF